MVILYIIYMGFFRQMIILRREMDGMLKDTISRCHIVRSDQPRVREATGPRMSFMGQKQQKHHTSCKILNCFGLVHNHILKSESLKVHM